LIEIETVFFNEQPDGSILPVGDGRAGWLPALESVEVEVTRQMERT